MSGNILSEIDHAVATLIFNNPERHNAVSLNMWQDATTALEQFEQDPQVRVVVLTGAGGKSFVSGADISEFESVRADAAGAAHYGAITERFWSALANHPKPTIAMIRGYCIGGGVNIAACCDLRVCTEASRFAVTAARIGLGYGHVLTRRLMELVGPQFAAEILLTARQFSAAEALRIGLVNHVVADADLEKHVQGLVDMIAANAPLTMRATKRIIRELLHDVQNRDMAACDALVKQCFASADYQEGRRAFLEKRKPVFTGQ